MMQKNSTSLTLYVLIITLVGAGFLIFTFHDVVKADMQNFIIFSVFSVITECLPVSLPSGGGVTVGFAVVLAAILLFGTSFAVWIAFLGVFITKAFLSKKIPLDKIAFNSGMFAIMAGVSGLIYERLGGIPGDLTPSFSSNIFTIIITVLSYYLINVSLVAIVLTLDKGLSPYRVWIKNLKWSAPNYLALASVGILIAYVYNSLGIIGIFLLLIPLIIIRNSFKLYVDMRRVYLDTIQALAAAIEAKDPYTRGHSERVAQYAVAIARELDLPEEEIDTIHYAALLHDIGKIGISENILNKPSTLSEEEFEKIKSHPVIGSTIVGRVNFLSKASDLIRYHHERANGSGYPEGLISGQIPRGAEILAVTDVFDALSSDRPYRKAWEMEELVNKLIIDSGREFNPEVVESLIRVLKKEGRISSDAS